MIILVRISDADHSFNFELKSGFIAVNNSITGIIKCSSEEATMILQAKLSAILIVAIERHDRPVLSSLRVERANAEPDGLMVDLVALKVA